MPSLSTTGPAGREDQSVRADAEIRRLALGCLLPGLGGRRIPGWLAGALADGLGGVVLFGSNVGPTVADVRRLTDQLRTTAGREVVVGIDEEGGDVTRLAPHTPASPGAAALGRLDDVDTTTAVHAVIGTRLVAAGITLNLAPVADVNLDPANPVIGVRSFGDDPDLVARHVDAAVRGLQRAGVAACAKHFPGHVATRTDSHHEAATLDRSRAELDAAELVPFRAAVAAGAQAVMTAHLIVPALDRDALATVSAAITTDLLRRELGFAGTIVTDALEMAALAGPIGMVEGFVRGLVAGADAIETGALEYPHLIEEIPAAVLGAVRSGRLDEQRLVDAARRTAQLGRCPDSPRPSGLAGEAALVASAAARSLEGPAELARLRRPLVVECRPPNGMATGRRRWSLAERIAVACAGTEIVVATGPLDVAALTARAGGRSLVVVVRDPPRNPWQQPVIALAAAHPDAVLVDVGWPAELPPGLVGLRTRGIESELLDAAARRLCPGGPPPDLDAGQLDQVAAEERIA